MDYIAVDYMDHMWIMCLLELLDSNNAFIITVLQGEARHNIGQFGNSRWSGHGDHTLEMAAAPGTLKKINNSIFSDDDVESEIHFICSPIINSAQDNSIKYILSQLLFFFPKTSTVPHRGIILPLQLVFKWSKVGLQ